MPIEYVGPDASGKPGYRWGKEGKVYRYTSGDVQSRLEARRKAAKQGRAVEASKYAR